ncbi:N-acetyltransferase, putative [Ricinus communis]|uniref:N-acetyltransferase, putative n=1 Tax=Ricinus communis TaxID=3988 RepID=B9TDR4_RICCO|nr:N-acetyltransferase, putative [Ricinus communis]
MTVLTTTRLQLQPFDDHHYDGLRALNTNPEVMRHITGRPETAEETTALIARVKSAWATLGYAWWALIDSESGRLIGSGCIQNIERNPANPLEIGWRLAPDAQGKGYATEAAQAMANFAFDTLKTKELVAVCHPDNTGSEKVMQRLGMTYRGVERWYNTDTTVYVMTKDEWRQA